MNTDEVRKIFKQHKTGAIGRHSFYSVLIPFVEKDGELNILYEVRSDEVNQPGEVCFPGGEMHPYEMPAECALREASEELGVSQYAIEAVGRGDTLYGSADFTLYTVAGIMRLNEYRKIRPNREVKEVFLVPVRELMAVKPEIHTEDMAAQIEKDFPYDRVGITKDYKWRTPKVEIPIYEVADHVIWGITGRITKSVLEMLAGGEEEK